MKRQDLYTMPEWLSEKVIANLEKLVMQKTAESRAEAFRQLTKAFPNRASSSLDQLISKIRSNAEMKAQFAKEDQMVKDRLQQEIAEKELQREEIRQARLDLGFTEEEIKAMEADDEIAARIETREESSQMEPTNGESDDVGSDFL